MSHFLSMGGYAAYVWPAYGISFIGVGGAIVWVLRDYSKAKTALAATEQARR